MGHGQMGFIWCRQSFKQHLHHSKKEKKKNIKNRRFYILKNPDFQLLLKGKLWPRWVHTFMPHGSTGVAQLLPLWVGRALPKSLHFLPQLLLYFSILLVLGK